MKCHYRIGGASAHVVSLSGVAPCAIPPHHPKSRFVRAVLVPRKSRGQGRARRLMERIMEDARSEGLPLVLRPVPYDGCPLSEVTLAAWYARLGFRYVGGWWDGTLMMEWSP